MSEDRELAEWGEQRKRRQRLIAWVLVIALVLGAGGATVLGLILN
ncbi:MAG TPA: hypothetical protein VNJ54_10070 [Plantibacter sp.]|nr:hypothetical protein [Plantibacter sp.]